MLINRENTFIVGDTIRLSVNFAIEEIPTDPTDVLFRIKNPNQVVSTTHYVERINIVAGEPHRTGVGVYHVDRRIDIPGEWWYRWEGSGDAPGALEGKFRVIASNVIG